MFGLRQRRRARSRAAGLTAEHDAGLALVAHWPMLAAATRDAAAAHARVLLDEKRFEGCAGLEVTDAMRVAIAAQASLLLLRSADRAFDRLRTILIYPREWRSHDVEPQDDGTVIEQEAVHAGESWGDSDVVILAWDDALAGLRHRSGRTNLILHEFAHQLDAETHADDGAPRFDDRALASRWSTVMHAAYDAHVAAVNADAYTVIDPYGAEHPAEFFAVVTESFFMDSARLRHAHPELHALLRAGFGLDPCAGWRLEPTD